MSDEVRVSRPKFTNSMKKRLLVICLFAVVAICFLIGRIMVITAKNGDDYARRVLSQQSYVSSVIPFRRGTITDRNGTVLAQSIKVYNIILDPKVALTYDYTLEPTIEALTDCFGFSREEIVTALDENAGSSYVRLRRFESYETVADFKARMSKNSHIKGVWFEEEYIRSYPFDSLASHVIGFANTSNSGFYGIEQYYNDYLNGVDGKEYGYYDSELNLKTNIKDAHDGNTIVSTIDAAVQSSVEKHISEFLDTYDCDSIGIVVADPNNGEILGMGSNREFNLNNPRSLEGIIPEDELENMSDEDKSNALYSLWRNFCVSDAYEPGSTFKTITVASALEANSVKTGDRFDCTGSREVGGWTISCSAHSGHGDISLAESLSKSCNCALMDIAAQLGSGRFYSYQNRFGFGNVTGVDLVGESTGQVVKESSLHETELATSSFGTRFTVTMMQMVGAYSSIINGGTYYKPHVVKKVLDADGRTIEDIGGIEVKQTVSSTTSRFIRESLRLTVTSGTGTPASLEGYTVAGKTGTAEKLPKNSGKYVISFMGFAPYDDPRILVYAVVDELHDEEKAGSSSVCSSMVGSIMSEILPYLEIYPEKENVDL